MKTYVLVPSGKKSFRVEVPEGCKVSFDGIEGTVYFRRPTDEQIAMFQGIESVWVKDEVTVK